METASRKQEQALKFANAAQIQGNKLGSRTLSMLLATESLGLYPNVEADIALRAQLALKPRIIQANLPGAKRMSELTFALGDRLLAGRTIDDELRVWDTSGWQLRNTGAAAAGCKRFWLDPSGTLLAIQNNDDRLALWKIDDIAWARHEPQITLGAPPEAVVIRFDGAYLAARIHSTESKWEVFDIRRGKLCFQAESFSSAFAFSGTGDHCASLSAPGEIRVYELPTGKLIQSMAVPRRDPKDPANPFVKSLLFRESRRQIFNPKCGLQPRWRMVRELRSR